MKEFKLIGWLKETFGEGGDSSVPVGIGDDMAVVGFGGSEFLFGSDMLVEGVHFRLGEAEGRRIGRKAIGVCLSDCAAMGGKPMYCVVSVGICDNVSDEFVKDVFLGIKELGESMGCRVVGGDLSRSERFVIDVALVGYCEKGKAILRSGAKVGDTVYVSGKVGGSLLGRHFDFVPRIREANWLVEHLSVNAMTDISDGLGIDLLHICESSGCVAEIYEDKLERVISEDACKVALGSGKSGLYHALNDGEDFELIVCAAESEDELPELADFLDLYAIGCIVSRGKGRVRIVRRDGAKEELSACGYQHFS